LRSGAIGNGACQGRRSFAYLQGFFQNNKQGRHAYDLKFTPWSIYNALNAATPLLKLVASIPKFEIWRHFPGDFGILLTRCHQENDVAALVSFYAASGSHLFNYNSVEWKK
jgi:hypothetical protein